eukprot:CAMPEP_0117423262 /NCGR_PEP_ID=MMETSP0758-20121206/3929_1 /TAXON_ID=63605 /ORGANISM="Percolomonas cosmopolitus, Strain AE-1 (ATCC 50343)" /LENGTH=507 /DNA_ID=CAMNT_0005206361 /DNA_START=47 /DNA_END=1570 /DNA_ORIENTATION=+
MMRVANLMGNNVRRGYNALVSGYIREITPTHSGDVDLEGHYTVRDLRESDINVDLNFSLLKEDIAPFFYASRNKEFKDLQNMTYGKVIGDNRGLEVDHTSEAKGYDVFWTDPILKEINHTNILNETFYRRTTKELTWYMCYLPHIFVMDGEIANVSMRIISDNSVTASFARQMMRQWTRLGNPHHYKYKGLVLHAAGFQFTDEHVREEYAGPKPSDLGLTREEFMLTNEIKKYTYVSALVEQDKIMQAAIFHAARASYLKHGSLVVRGDTLAKGSNITCFINNDINDKLQVRNNSVYAAHHSVLTEAGVSRAWNGIFSSQVKEPEEGEFVKEKSGGATRTAVRQPRSVPNMLKSPNNYVFTIQDDSNTLPALTKITQNFASLLYTAGLTSISKNGEYAFNEQYSPDNFVAPVPSVEALPLFLKVTKGANFYIVNTASKNTVTCAEFVAAGSADSASTEDLGSNMERVIHKSIQKSGSTTKPAFQRFVKEVTTAANKTKAPFEKKEQL